MLSPNSGTANPSLAWDGHHSHLVGLAKLLSDECFRLRFLGGDEGETKVSSSMPQFIDRELWSGDLFTTWAGGVCERFITTQIRKPGRTADPLFILVVFRV